MTFVHNCITRKPREIAMHLLLCSHSKTVYNPHRQVTVGAAVPPLRFECKKVQQGHCFHFTPHLTCRTDTAWNAAETTLSPFR